MIQFINNLLNLLTTQQHFSLIIRQRESRYYFNLLLQTDLPRNTALQKIKRRH